MKGCLPRKPFTSIVTYLAALTVAILGMSELAVAKGIVTPSGATIEYSRSPSVLVINYALHVGEIATSEGHPGLQIFGDGLVQVYYPPYMARAGQYQLQLSDNEMSGLLVSLVSDGVLEFDPSAAQTTARAIDTLKMEDEGLMTFVSDRSISLIEMHIERYTPSGTMAIQSVNVTKTIRWKGLQSDARLYPGHAAIQNLANAEQRLRFYMESPDLSRAGSQRREAATAPQQD